jgi:hypothetical protein
MTQYVHPCNAGLVRIVKHGRRWRTLLGEHEAGRHDSIEAALLAARARWPQARIPAALHGWRELPEPRRLGQRDIARGAARHAGFNRPGFPGGAGSATRRHGVARSCCAG